MSTFKSFEEIEVWQKARTLVREVYRVSGEGNFARDFALRDQIRRAAISVMSNIAEGHGRGGTREFIQFLSVAKASATEMISQLFIALDQNYINTEVFQDLKERSDEVCRMITGLMKYLRTVPSKGSKYKQAH